MKTILKTLLGTASLLSVMSSAHAHVAFNADNAYGMTTAFTGKTYYATMNLGHGCEDLEGTLYDTLKIEVSVPAGISSVRPIDAPFGAATVEKDSNGNVTKMIWTKTATGAANDDFLYQVKFKGSLKDVAALSTLEFPTTQTCTGDTTISWEGAEVPKLLVLPTRKPGWNKYTAQADISLDTVKAFFADANIVWANKKAYSANPATDALITQKLESISAGTEYWVKY